MELKRERYKDGQLKIFNRLFQTQVTWMKLSQVKENAAKKYNKLPNKKS